jgi:hypothetical protein
MPKVLTTNASIKCPHTGVGTSIPTDPKWTINGGTVLLENDKGILSCPFIPLPCAGYQLKSMGLNATQVDSRKVILDTDFNQTFTGLPLIIQEFHQTIDNSTPAPIPPGQKAPPLPPGLADIVTPVVTGTPAALGFSSITPPPVPLIITFTLISDHPREWVLTLISVPKTSPASHQNITNGLPLLGLVVAPAGGSWNASTPPVIVTLTPPYLATLGPGDYRFFMTGVSQRGLSGHIEVVLTVS